MGAGYTGLSAALHLAQAGVSVAVLEAAEIGAGGSGRNVGLVNAGLWLMPDDLMARAGPDHGPRLLDALAAAPALVWELVRAHDLDCEASPNGTLHCAADASGARALAARAAQWHKRGADVVLLDRATTAACTGSDAFTAALFDPRAGTIQPLAYARALARAAMAQGAVIHTHSPLRDLTRAGAGWQLRTDQGRIDAQTVIIATNAYSTKPLDDLGHEMAILPYFNFATDPLPASLLAQILPGREGVWDTRKILTSFRLDAAGRFIIGSVGQLGQFDADIHRAWAARRMVALFPQLRGQPLRQGWWGRIGTTPDALPRLHQLGPDIWSISGYNGRGIGPGTVFGKMLAGLASGSSDPRDIPLPLAPIRPDRLRHLRHALFRAGAAALHLAARRG